jgi:hypothetical protein
MMNALLKANMVDKVRRTPVAKAKLSPGVDTWSDAARIERIGGGTCPSLVAARVAELRKSGEHARWSFGFEGRLVVIRASGEQEDVCGGAPIFGPLLVRRALWTPTMELVSFETTPPDLKMKVLCKLLDVLHTANGQWLAAGNKAPPLYESGFRYVEEQMGKDEWQDIPETIRRKTGDCEDFASYRVSELRAAGEKANHAVEHRYSKADDIVLYHILVLRQDGSMEDPSCRLGMGGVCHVHLTGAQVAAKVQKAKQQHTGAVAPVVHTAEDVVAALLGRRVEV